MSDVEPVVPEEAPAAEAVSPTEIEGIMAMTSDAGLVVTLLQKDANGPVYRHGSEWVPVVDPSAFDGLTFVGVDEDSVATYDQYETNDLLAPISEYTPSMGGPFWPDVIEKDGDDELVLDEETGIYAAVDGSEEDEERSEVGPSEDDEPEEEAVTASVRLDTVDDLTAAVDAAVRDPDLRWFVERRVAALGLEASLPWQQS